MEKMYQVKIMIKAKIYQILENYLKMKLKIIFCFLMKMEMILIKMMKKD